MFHDAAQPLQWGLDEEAVHPIKATSVGTVIQIGNREFMAITSQRIIRFEPSVVSAYLPYQLTALVCIPEFQVVVGVTAISAEFVVILLDDVKKPIFPGIKANDASVFNILYCPKYNTLITSGEDLKTWKFTFLQNKKTSIVNPPQIRIEYQRTIIHKFQGSILNPPIIDHETEIIYIDDQKGSLQKYKFDGTCIGTALKFQSMSITTVAFNYESKKFLTSNSDQGAILWHRTGHLLNRYFLSNAAALAIRFLNKEFALIFDANNVLTVLDVKTSRSFACYKVSSGRISRIFYFEKPIPRVILCCNSSIVILKVVLPWKLWCTTISKPLSMIRCPKFNEAARLLVMCSDSHVKLISPSKRSTLTAITLQSLAQPIGFFYDRGTSFLKRDQVMLPLKDGTMQIFSTGENPCKMVSSFEAKSICMCQCKYKNMDCFVFGTSSGSLLFYDYFELKQINWAVLPPYPIIQIFNYNDSLCVVYIDCLIRFSLKDEKIFESLDIKGSEISILFNGIMVFGYETGEIGCATIDKNQNLVEYFTNGLKIHDNKVTGLSFGSSYFVSCSTDMSLRVWSTEFTLISKITFPIPLISVAILNGKRDVVVGTESEIMFVDGNTIFHGVVDKEDETYDNYDKLQDFLDSQFAKISENNNQGNGTSFLSSYRQKEECSETVKSKPKNSKIRMFQEALKKHQEMLEQQSNKFKNEIDNVSNNKNSKKDNIENDLEKREILFNQMNTITNGTKRNDADQINNILQIERADALKKQKLEIEEEEEENDDEYEYEYEEEDEDNAKNVKPQNDTDSKQKSEETKTKKNEESPPILMKNVLNDDYEPKIQNDNNSSNENQNNENDQTEIKPPISKKTKRPSRRALRRNDTIPSDQLNQNLYQKDDINENNNENTIGQTNPSNQKLNKDENENIDNKNNKKNDISKNNKKVKDNNNNIMNGDEYKENNIIEEQNDETQMKENEGNNDILNSENQNSKQNSGKKVRRLGEPSQTGSKQKNLDLKMKSQSKQKSDNKNKQKKNSSKLNEFNSEFCGTEIKSNDSKEQHKNVIKVNKATSPNSHSKLDDFPPEKVKKQTKNIASKIRNKPEFNSLVDKHISSSIGNKTKMNMMLVNNRLFDVNYEKQRHNQRSANEKERQKAPIINKTRRFPTPLHYTKPVASLFERSIKTRRPKTPPCSKGLLISNSVVPTNIVFDASVLDEILKSNDTYFQPLIKQLKPILKSQHAYFNLRVMLPPAKIEKKKHCLNQNNSSLSTHRLTSQIEKHSSANPKNLLNFESISIPPLSINTISNNNYKSTKINNNNNISVQNGFENNNNNTLVDNNNNDNCDNCFNNCNIFNIDSNNLNYNVEQNNNIDKTNQNNYYLYNNNNNINDSNNNINDSNNNINDSNNNINDSNNNINDSNNKFTNSFNGDNNNMELNNIDNNSVLALNNINIDGDILSINNKSIGNNNNSEYFRTNNNNNSNNNNNNETIDLIIHNNTINTNNDTDELDVSNNNKNQVSSTKNRLSISNGIFSNEILSFENKFVISEPFKDSNKFISPRFNNNYSNNSNTKNNRIISTAIAHINDSNIKKEEQRKNKNINNCKYNHNIDSDNIDSDNIDNNNNFFNRRKSEIDRSNYLRNMDKCNNNNDIRYVNNSNDGILKCNDNVLYNEYVSNSSSEKEYNGILRPNRFMTIRGEKYQYRVDRPNLVEQATYNKRKISCPQTSRFIGPTNRGLLTPRKLVSVNPGKSIAFPRCLLIVGNNATKNKHKSSSPRK